MFGKPRDGDDSDLLDSSAIDGFFGDEAAAANALEVHELAHRVEQVEAQISSQFTSLATYAQISQEQIELARSEAKAATERSEQRLTSLVERERADRISFVHRPGPCRVGARRHRPSRRTRALRRPDPQGPRRVPAASEGTGRRHHDHVRTSRPGPAGRRARASEPEQPVAPVVSFAPPSLVAPAGAPATDRPAVTPLSGPIADLSLNA